MSALTTAIVLLAFMGARAGAVQDSILPDIPVTVGFAASPIMGGAPTGPNNSVPLRYSTTFTLPALPVWGFIARGRVVHPDSLVPITTFHYSRETQILVDKARYDLARDALLLLESVSPDSAAIVAEIRLVGERYRAVKAPPETPIRIKVRIQGDRPTPPGKR